ncbi:MAG: hypothetical protein AAGF93_19475 [Cyanobacteria bacterium P01_H01_bin.105]
MVRNDGDVGLLDGIFGTSRADVFNLANGKIFYGRGGNDRLANLRGTLPGGDSLSVLAGGRGSDTYTINPNSTVVIAENGGLGIDRIVDNFSGGNSDSTFFLTIENRHLLIGDFATDTYIILLDWQQSANRIDEFVDSFARRASFSDISSFFLANSAGNFSFSQLQQGFFITPQGGPLFSDFFDLDLSLAGFSPSTVNSGINEIFNRAVSQDDFVLRRGNRYFADTDLDGLAELSVTFGRSTDIVEFADLSGDGQDDLVLRRGNRYFADTDSDGLAELSVTFGRSTDIVEFADLNGDGQDDLVLRRGNRYFADTDLDGLAELSIAFGRSTDIVEFADLSGDGQDDLLLRRGNRYFIDNDADGLAERSTAFGRSTDIVEFADLNGDSITDLVLRRGNRYFADTDLDGIAELSVTFGRSDDVVTFADLNGDGQDDILLRRGNRYFLDTNLDGIAGGSLAFGRSTDIVTFADLA